MSLVVDSSIVLSWCFEDEQTDVSREVLHRVRDGGAVVPVVWRFEVANALQMAVRRRRINARYRDATLDDLDTMDVAVDPESNAQAWSASVHLADRHVLTVYDASYLELAQRRRLELATLDKQLATAGRAELVPVIGA